MINNNIIDLTSGMNYNNVWKEYVSVVVVVKQKNILNQ